MVIAVNPSSPALTSRKDVRSTTHFPPATKDRENGGWYELGKRLLKHCFLRSP